MTHQELIKRLKGIRVWIPQNSNARIKIDELIELLSK